MDAKLQQIMAANKNHTRRNESVEEQLPASMTHNTAEEQQWKHRRIQSRKDVFHLLCYKVIGFRLYSGQCVTSYLEADTKKDPTLAHIVVLWQQSQRNPNTLGEGREKFSAYT